MKILVAESKIENTRRVKDMLSQTQQYAVVEANTANDALTLLQDQQFDCVFIGAHFFGEAHELRAMVTQHDISHAPVVIIAGHVPDKSLEESSLAESPVADSSLTQFSLTEPRVAEFQAFLAMSPRPFRFVILSVQSILLVPALNASKSWSVK